MFETGSYHKVVRNWSFTDPRYGHMMVLEGDMVHVLQQDPLDSENPTVVFDNMAEQSVRGFSTLPEYQMSRKDFLQVIGKPSESAAPCHYTATDESEPVRAVS